ATPHWLERLSRTVKNGATWRFSLETRSSFEESSPPGFGIRDSVRASSLAFFPVIHGNSVFISDTRYVTAYDFVTGEATNWFGAKVLNDSLDVNLKLPAAPDLRYSLTADHDCLYVRLGAQDIRFLNSGDRNDQNKMSGSFLACLSLDPE